MHNNPRESLVPPDPSAQALHRLEHRPRRRVALLAPSLGRGAGGGCHALRLVQGQAHPFGRLIAVLVALALIGTERRCAACHWTCSMMMRERGRFARTK